MGTSYTNLGDRGFWTRDAALETVLALLVVELQSSADRREVLDSTLDDWTLQAVVGFMGCVSPALDEHLDGPATASIVADALSRIGGRLPVSGEVVVAAAELRVRAERVCGEGAWRPPSASADAVRCVAEALRELISGELPALSAGMWFVNGAGRKVLPRRNG